MAAEFSSDGSKANAMIDTSVAEAARRPPAILVVEDEILIRVAIVQHLQDCGYHVFGVSNADEAMSVIDRNEVHIDLVFTDVRMPGTMDGWGLAAWMRAHHPEMAVIVASAERWQVADELCRDLPFLQKPYDFDDVASRIAALLRKAA
jgi:DNA-binding NtrC family response regulator